MQKELLISVDEFCTNHNIKTSFISTLQKNGLIEIITIKESVFVDREQLKQLEKIVRLYYELDINMEGIETISYLLQKIISMQDEMMVLRNRLRLYEGDM